MRNLARSMAGAMPDWTAHPNRSCPFCGRNEDRVARLVAGPSAHMCESCIAERVAVLDWHGGFDRPGPTQSH
jgi:hypothetical protein